MGDGVRRSGVVGGGLSGGVGGDLGGGEMPWRDGVGVVADGAGDVEDIFFFEGILVLEFLVVGDFAMGAEEGVAHGVEEASFAEGDAIFEDRDEKFGEDAADVIGRIENGGGLGEFCLESLVGGGVVVGFGRVDETESGIGGADGLGAAASGGGEMGAAGEGEITNGVEEFHFGSFLKADAKVEIGRVKTENCSDVFS